MSSRGEHEIDPPGLAENRCEIVACGKKLEALIERCQISGLRQTRALENLLHAFLESDRPMSLNQLCESEHLARQCDKTTVFRLLKRLASREIVRHLGVSGRPAHFYLVDSGSSDGYLICTGCGSIETVPTPGPIQELRDHIPKTSGYTRLYYEFEIYGLCPHCS